MDELKKLISRKEDIEREYDRLEEKKRILSIKIHNMAKFDSAEKRKERSIRLFKKGGMVEMILSDKNFDEEFFIGCLLGIKEIEVGSDSYLRFKQNGKKFLEAK